VIAELGEHEMLRKKRKKGKELESWRRDADLSSVSISHRPKLVNVNYDQQAQESYRLHRTSIRFKISAVSLLGGNYWSVICDGGEA